MTRHQILRSLVLVGFGATLAGGGLTLAPGATATPLSYLQSLNDHGLNVYDTTAALTSGYQICTALNVYNGEQVAQAVYDNTPYADVPDLDTARIMVLVSVEELCPQHDHRGQSAPTSAAGELVRA